MKANRKKLGICIALLIFATVASPGAMLSIPGDPVTIDSGKVAGTLLDSGARAYYGIPFAAPPVRELRWHEPLPVKPWKGIYNADREMPQCMQPLRAATRDRYYENNAEGEDCLYLNLWAPAAASGGARLPVIVWIYGGGFSEGSASYGMYGGQELVKKGIIYVAISYRVGIFGFLAHPDLTKESGHHASGNWGMLDQIAALKWVQRNIGAFGGDPSNVTLIGQSAGAMSINDLNVSPMARGLFARLIGLSGTFMPTGGMPQETLQEAEAMGTKLQMAMKASGLEDMRAAAPDRVAAIAQQTGIRAWPDIDGYFISARPESIFAAGKQNDVPMLVCSTAKDIGSNNPIGEAKSLDDYKRLASTVYGGKAEAFLKAWPASNDAEAVKQAYEVIKNSGFGLSDRDWARHQVQTGRQPAWLTVFTRVHPFVPGVTFSDLDPARDGAYHTGDVPYWLGTYETMNLFRHTRNWTTWDRELSDKMQNAIVAFAKTGSPDTPALKFIKYDPNNEQRIVFGDSIYVEKLNTPGLEFIEANPLGAGRGGRERR